FVLAKGGDSIYYLLEQYFRGRWFGINSRLLNDFAGTADERAFESSSSEIDADKCGFACLTLCHRGVRCSRVKISRLASEDSKAVKRMSILAKCARILRPKMLRSF